MRKAILYILSAVGILMAIAEPAEGADWLKTFCVTKAVAAACFITVLISIRRHEHAGGEA